jgi:hypothetical protein
MKTKLQIVGMLVLATLFVSGFAEKIQQSFTDRLTEGKNAGLGGGAHVYAASNHNL